MKRLTILLSFAIYFLFSIAAVFSSACSQSKEPEKVTPTSAHKKSVPAEEKRAELPRLTYRYVNGEEIILNDNTPPLAHLSLNELELRVNREEPDAIYELSCGYVGGRTKITT